jgi:diaminopimelate decarboxylase
VIEADASLTDYWEGLVAEALKRWTTPFYLCSWRPLEAKYRRIADLDLGLPIRQWLSLKTHPVGSLLRTWRKEDRDVEVVSECELHAALNEKFEPDRILVNGVAKTDWLAGLRVRGLRVHFDSMLEVDQLRELAAELDWRCGLRIHVRGQYDPDEPAFGDQFGLTETETVEAVRRLRQANVLLESAHFHLRSNVTSVNAYGEALQDLSKICEQAKFLPKYIDCGGGLPALGEDLRMNVDPELDALTSWESALAEAPKQFDGLEEIWSENGRYLSSSSGVLVVTVRDIKYRSDCRYLICDGGRTNHARVSEWEQHAIALLPQRGGKEVLTTVCGPTCMAYDRLCRTSLPETIKVGDRLVWFNAGAYHIPWETRFSMGLARVIWADKQGELSVARHPETPEKWWSTWNA